MHNKFYILFFFSCMVMRNVLAGNLALINLNWLLTSISSQEICISLNAKYVDLF